jgi:hypothetical protein
MPPTRWSPVAIMRTAMAVVFVTGIVGMIVSTVAADNNNGAVVTFGVFAAIAAVSLIAFTFGHRLGVATRLRVPAPIDDPVDDPLDDPVDDPVDDPLDDPEVVGESLEAQIVSLVASGADEAAVRDLAGQAVKLGRVSAT